MRYHPFLLKGDVHAELDTVADLSQLPILWAVPDLIPCHRLTLITGPSGVGLTDLACRLLAQTAPVNHLLDVPSWASLIDGAGYWQRVQHIYLPLTARTILLVTLISAIGSMLAFEQLYIMTAGGPNGLTFTSVYWVYQSSFIKFQLGYGSALAVILTAIIMAGAAVQITLTARRAA